MSKHRIQPNAQNYGVHMNHCFQGENLTNCAYGQDDICPAYPISGPVTAIVTLRIRAEHDKVLEYHLKRLRENTDITITEILHPKPVVPKEPKPRKGMRRAAKKRYYHVTQGGWYVVLAYNQKAVARHAREVEGGYREIRRADAGDVERYRRQSGQEPEELMGFD